MTISFQYAIRRNDPVAEQRDRELEDYLARNLRAVLPDNVAVIRAPGGGGDDYQVIQDALDAYDVVLLGAGTYRADGLVVPTNTTLGTLSEGHGLADYGSAKTVIQARDGATSSYVVSFSNGTSPRHESQALIGIAISGNQVCGGVYTEGWYGVLRGVHISETDGPSLNVQSQSILVDRCITTGPYWPSVNPGAASGGVIIGGADSWFRDCEFSGSNVTGFNYRGNTVAAVYVTGGYHSFVGCIAEYGDYGWHLTSSALFNKFSTCRADRNLGHGWYNQGSYNLISSCSSSDSNVEDDGYSQWYTTGIYNQYAACSSWNALAGADSDYGFYDGVSAGANQNQYAACGAPNGWATAEFGGVGFDARPVAASTMTATNLEFPAAVGEKIDWYKDTGYTTSVEAFNLVDDIPSAAKRSLRINGSETFRADDDGINIVSGDVRVQDTGFGLILRSAAGDYWRVTVDNSGALVTTLV